MDSATNSDTMIHKLSLTIALLLFVITTTFAQGDGRVRQHHEFHRNIPVYAEQIVADMKFPMAWGNSKIKNFKKWKKVAREKVFECMLTPPPMPEKVTFKVIDEEQREGYRAKKLEIRLSEYYTVPALLLIPDGKGPFPAVNALHDHGGHYFIGKEKMIRPFRNESPEVIEDAQKWADNLYDGQFVGDYLAQHGYVVFSSDAPMWGDRGRSEGSDHVNYDVIAGNMMMYGVDLSAWMTYDDIRGTEFLASLPEVDASRIGSIGCSMGGYRSWMLSALSDVVKAGVSVCWMINAEAQMTLKYGWSENGGFANCFPGMRQWMDYPHIASLACPKPMLFINGKQDKLFAVPGVQECFNTMHEVWKSQEADDQLTTELWDIPHSCGTKVQKRVLEFFQKNL